VDNCDSLAAIYVGTAIDRGNGAHIGDVCSSADRSARCATVEKLNTGGTLDCKSVSPPPHLITNSELFPQKHKKSALANVLSLAVEWLK
jgi:hypothetical protein